MKSRELREKLGQLTTQLRQILEGAEKDKRVKLNADEEARYAAVETDITDLEAQIKRVDAQEKREADQAKTLNEHEEGKETRAAGDPAKPEESRGQLPETIVLRPEIRKAFGHLPAEVQRRLLNRCSDTYRNNFAGYLVSGRDGIVGGQEWRAMQADAFATGGAMVAPMQFVAELLKALDDEVYIRKFATVRQVVNAQSLGVPSLDADPADWDWTSELGTGNEDSTMAFGSRELTPHPLAKRLKISRKLLRISAINPEQLVRERLTYKEAVTQEKAFLTGSGAQQPLGMFTASADGIPTSRDVATGSATDLTGDGLIDALYSLKAAYQGRATWGFHRDGIKRVRKLKDVATGQYLWQPGLQGGQPSTILDRPFFMSEFIPNTFTSGLYVGIVGDLSFYWIADSLEVSIQRLDELYAETNQVGFIGRLECDGMPALGEAFARLKTN